MDQFQRSTSLHMPRLSSNWRRPKITQPPVRQTTSSADQQLKCRTVLDLPPLISPSKKWYAGTCCSTTSCQFRIPSPLL